MRLFRPLMIVTIAVGTLAGGPTSARIPGLEEAAPASKAHVRVLYLQGIDLREAMTLVRSQAQVRSVASAKDRNAIVVRDTAEVVDRCETLLRERDAVARVADPHEPVDLERPTEETAVTGVFRVAGDNMGTVVVILRAIYSVRELGERYADSTVSLRVTQAVLDSSEALLRELDLLDLPVASEALHQP